MAMLIVNGFQTKFEDISFFPHHFSTFFRVCNVFTTLLWGPPYVIKNNLSLWHMANRSNLSFKGISRIISKKQFQRYPNYVRQVKNDRVTPVRHMSTSTTSVNYANYVYYVRQVKNERVTPVCHMSFPGLRMVHFMTYGEPLGFEF